MRNRALIVILMVTLGAFFNQRCLGQDSRPADGAGSAAVTSQATGIVREICMKPEKGDRRPTTRFLLVKETGEGVLLMLPHKSSEQDAQIGEILQACIEQEILATFTGTIEIYTNNFGTTQYLKISRMQVATEHQVITFTWP